ncbi:MULTISPECIES: AraC family transcriptional regulator [unclassified Fusibacter]|uniref:helix-turn-helix domain-containing protein n=1 Tax=unclassified Fusibacter TaxID=2624464 RepID=UPI0010120690|nr:MULTISPECIES: AraC family transcriptional regulator [unclassified Fusibacter]MCK8059240.1 AraC family transcriptional regulator [Fusibacter sp. A2]NPE21296.1 helix-turn-helix transcriptional regulator [Fusibacter sp. A1]RXV62560.1 AraC family transcriptional regulator [Fusibacter sp. A1]
MKSFYENQKFIVGGVSYPFRSHIQEAVGQRVMVEAHYHTYIEILYCLSGSFSIFLDGKGDTFYKGDMVVINSMEVHYIRALSEGNNKYIVIRFDPELLYTTTQTIFEAKYVLPFTMLHATHQKIFRHHEISATFLPQLLNEILVEDAQKKYGFELAVRTHIGRIFLWILRTWNEQGLDLNLCYAFNQETIERLQKVFDHVENHYDRVITIDEMAQLSNMSYSYFSRFFKSAMQRNFSDYVNHVRVSKAENLLATTDFSITDVALSVGFSTSSYFIQQFKHYKNMTPRQFRANFKSLVDRYE